MASSSPSAFFSSRQTRRKRPTRRTQSRSCSGRSGSGARRRWHSSSLLLKAAGEPILADVLPPSRRRPRRIHAPAGCTAVRERANAPWPPSRDMPPVEVAGIGNTAARLMEAFQFPKEITHLGVPPRTWANTGGLLGRPTAVLPQRSHVAPSRRRRTVPESVAPVVATLAMLRKRGEHFLRTTMRSCTPDSRGQGASAAQVSELTKLRCPPASDSCPA